MSFLAFDLGAGSGRAILGDYSAGRLTIQEIHRFSNEPVRYNGGWHWDAARLWLEIRNALGGVGGYTSRLEGIGVDTWGVDYALLGEGGTLLDNPFHYRDARTEGCVEAVCGRLSREEIYAETGVQFAPYNTLMQLYAAAERTPRLLEHAQSLVNMPDLFNFWLTGVIASEYTIASTTQCLNSKTRNWATDLLERLGIPRHFLSPIVAPGSILGPLLPELAGERGLGSTLVIAPACHDTASAFASVASDRATAILSSGTWSLLGAELPAPVINERSMGWNFTNEGGAANTTRLLKNITGLWLMEGCRQAWQAAGETLTYADLIAAAEAATPLAHWLDPDDAGFVRPADMTQAISAFCTRTGQPAPASPGAFVRAILESLALKYRLVLEQLRELTGHEMDTLRVIGGGSQNRMLNQFTANATGCRVLAGPAEATALGNLALQMVATGRIESLTAAREMIAESFPALIFEPRPDRRWEAQYDKLRAWLSW